MVLLLFITLIWVAIFECRASWIFALVQCCSNGWLGISWKVHKGKSECSECYHNGLQANITACFCNMLPMEIPVKGSESSVWLFRSSYSARSIWVHCPSLCCTSRKLKDSQGIDSNESWFTTNSEQQWRPTTFPFYSEWK